VVIPIIPLRKYLNFICPNSFLVKSFFSKDSGGSEEGEPGFNFVSHDCITTRTVFLIVSMGYPRRIGKTIYTYPSTLITPGFSLSVNSNSTVSLRKFFKTSAR